MTPEAAKQLVEALGLEYHGAKPYPRNGRDCQLHYFSDPTTKATLNLWDGELTADAVQAKVAASRSLFSAARA